MSPTSRELVSNKALSGIELAEIIRADVDRMLQGNGFLRGQTAFSRVSYELRLTLHLDLPSMDLTTDSARSRTQPVGDVRDNPALAAIEPSMPLSTPSADAILESTELHRDIQSPNLARIEHSLPIEVEVTGQDGHVREQLIQYTPTDVGMKGEDFPVPDIADLTPRMRKELGL